jgi:hypothetical protein
LSGTIVELRYAPLPAIGLIAVHYWFVVREATGKVERWEVWQTRNAGGRSIGHVHCNLKAPEDGVGGGPSRLARRYTAREAEAIRQVLSCAARYPHCERYVLYPGPNSNSFVAWVLREAGVRHRLGWRAHGARYRFSRG